ncbi:MAG: LLM class flavin-dependent oxidoreductase [Nocardioides sp.]
MADLTRHLILNAFLMSNGHHEAAWRLPESDPFIGTEVDHWVELARLAERGLLDSVFFADSPGLWAGSDSVARRPAQTLEPTLLLSAMAQATSKVGLIATATTTYDEPFNTARRFATLDKISHGRAGWNVVTTASLAASANFSYAEPPTHAERYARANEYLEVVLGLWDGWEDAAELGDKDSGVHADPRRVHRLDHRGEHFQVEGPLNVGRSEQGHPVIVQAGSSVPGMALAARYAEAVFTAQRTLELGQSFYSQLKAATREAGRDPDHLKILPGVVPILGSTEEEARKLERRLDELIVLDHPLAQLSADIGIPVDQIDPDAPLPQNIRSAEEIEGNKARYELTVEFARKENLTVRELLWKLGGGRGHRTFTGTPEQLADDIQLWFENGAADGFNIMAPVFPSALEIFVEQVVPILQKRDLFRTEYAGSTLREHYGLPVPVSGARTRGPQPASV